MATLQKIRTRAGLLVAIVIGISLAAFILGDMLQSGTSMFQKDRLEVGVIDGESIQYPDFQKELEELGEIYKQNTGTTQLDENGWFQVREQAWNTFIRRIVMGEVYDNLGIQVSSDEMFDMVQGTNPHQIIQQIFRNPETGQVDRGAAVRFLKGLETTATPEQRRQWMYIENQILEERTQSKYTNMVGKGLYVTGEEAQNSLAVKNRKVNFDYIALNFSEISDSAVEVTEADLKAYYDKNKDDYKQEQIRKIEYITFPVEPSTADFEEAENWINDVKADFETATDNIQFVNSNSDESFVDVWNKKETLSENIGAWIFDEAAEVNDVFGPYFENNTYKLAKLHALEMVPDSVEARHILLQPVLNTQEEAIAMQALADSLKTEIENGADFAALATEYSKDQGSAINGGDLGFFGRGQMVKPFEDAAFANAKNEVSIAASQFGLHIIQTTDLGVTSQQAKVAYLTRQVVASTRTIQDTYAKASKFAGENTTRDDFDAAITEQKLNKRVAQMRENDRNIAGLENGRILIRAAYEAKVGEIIASTQGSPIFELGDNFVIAVLTEATEEGTAALAEVKERVELNVVKEKKAELLIEKAKAAMEGKTDIADIATALETTSENATNIDFNTYSIPGLGLEPAVVGTATSLEVDQISTPIKGNNGVYVVKVTSVNQGADEDLVAEQNRLAQGIGFRANSQALRAHQNSVEIEDKRTKFY